MQVAFDKFDRYEIPELILCNPNLTNLATIVPAHAPKFTMRFSAFSELEFDIYERNEFGDTVPYYSSLKKNRVVHVESGPAKGYWIISNTSIETDGNYELKTVHCYSYEYSLSLRAVDIDEGTYKFYSVSDTPDTNGKRCLLNQIGDKTRTWTIGNVSTDLTNKYRTFELPDEDIYSFLMNDVAEAYEAVFTFDIENFTIEAHTTAEIVKSTDIVFTYDNLMKNVSIEDTDDPIVTALDVYGSGDFSVALANPLGTPTIYKFDHFQNQMTPALWNKVAMWQSIIDYHMTNNIGPSGSSSLVNGEVLSVISGSYESANEMLSVPIGSVTSEVWKTAGNATLGTYLWYNMALKAKYKSRLDTQALIEDVNAVMRSAKDVQDVTLTLFSNESTETTYTTWLGSMRTWINSRTKAQMKTLFNNTSWTYPVINLDNLPSGAPAVPSVVTGDLRSYAQSVVNVDAGIHYSDLLWADFNADNDAIAEYQNAKASINATLIPANYFTSSELDELDKFVFGDTYTNEYFVVVTSTTTEEEPMTDADIIDLAIALYGQGKDALNKVSQPNFNFSLDAVNFLFDKEYGAFTAECQLGCTVNAEIREGDWVTPLLLEIEFDYENPDDFKLTWGNRYRLQTAEFTWADLNEQVQKTSGGMSANFSDMIKPVRSGEYDRMLDFINSSLDASRNAVLAGTDQAMQIDEHGILGRKKDPATGKYDDKQFRFINNMLVFTDNNWDTVKAAIGEIPVGNNSYYGINAELIMGKMIAGGQLTIANSSNTFVIDSGGLSFTHTPQGSSTPDQTFNLTDSGIGMGVPGFKIGDNGVEITNMSLSLLSGDKLKRVTMSAEDPFRVQTRANTSISWNNGSTNKLYIDTDGNLVMSGRINAESGEIGGFLILKDAAGNPTLINGKKIAVGGITITEEGEKQVIYGLTHLDSAGNGFPAFDGRGGEGAYFGIGMRSNGSLFYYKLPGSAQDYVPQQSYQTTSRILVFHNDNYQTANFKFYADHSYNSQLIYSAVNIVLGFGIDTTSSPQTYVDTANDVTWYKVTKQYFRYDYPNYTFRYTAEQPFGDGYGWIPVPNYQGAQVVVQSMQVQVLQ